MAKQKKWQFCPVCGKGYTERSKNRFRHWESGKVTWCKWHEKACPAIQAWDVPRACTCA